MIVADYFIGWWREVKALLVLRHEAPNELERAVGFSFFSMAYNGSAMISAWIKPCLRQAGAGFVQSRNQPELS